MIGTEMMAVVQVSFISLITLQSINPCFRALASLWLVNGYNLLSPNDYLEDPHTSEQPKGVYLFSRFMENYNLTGLLIGVPLVVALVAFILAKTALKSKAETLEKVRQRALGEYTFTGILFSGYLVFTSFMLELMYGIKSRTGVWGTGSMVLAFVLVALFISYLVFFLLRPAYFGEYTSSFKKDKFSAKFYVLPMVERAIIGSCLVALLSFNLEGIIPLIFFIGLGAVVILKRPYSKNYNNARVVANMAVCIAVESVYIWYRSASTEVKHDTPAAFYLPMFICVLLLVAVLYNSAALLYQLIQTIREFTTKSKF